MKKISFSERYGMQQGVIARTKTITRRENKKLNHPLVTGISEWGIDEQGKAYVAITYSTGLTEAVYPIYQVGEEVAVAQRYEDCWDYYQQLWEAKNDPSDWHTPDAILGDQVNETPGWKNKMFVRADLMPHRIRITDIRVERLKDISDEDCFCEGVEKAYLGYYVNGLKTKDWEKESHVEKEGKTYKLFPTPRDAFAALIDRISGRGTWQRNPWVYVYEFELIK